MHQIISKLLTEAESYSITGSHRLWTHKTRKISFCLCVDNFGIKYQKLEYPHHLQKLYSNLHWKINYEEETFLGFTLKWIYEQGYVDISVIGYVYPLLAKLQYPAPIKPQYSPHEYILKKWPRKGVWQYAQQQDTLPLLSTKETKRFQSALVSLLYCGRAIDCVILLGTCRNWRKTYVFKIYILILEVPIESILWHQYKD